MEAGPQKNYAVVLDHYKAISSEYTEFYKMYMQSWSIVASAIVVGIVFGLRDSQGLRSWISLQGILLCAVPFILLVWLLLTSWFWVYFVTYREYLCWLESAIRDLDISETVSRLICFHSYRQHWFKGWVEKGAVALVAILGLAIYAVFAGIAAGPLAWILGWGSPTFWFYGYLIIAILVLIFVVWLIYRIEPPNFD